MQQIRSRTRRPAAEPPERERRARGTRRRADEIIGAAAHVFAEKGYHGATTQDIADRLGIRQASLYYYFGSKEEALELVCRKGAEGFYERAYAIAAGGGSATEKLAALVRAHIEPLHDRAHFMKVFLDERRHLPRGSRARVAQWARALERTFERIIGEGMASGELRADLDPRLATLAILGMANAVPAWFAREGQSAEKVARQLVDIALGGVAQRRSDAAHAR